MTLISRRQRYIDSTAVSVLLYLQILRRLCCLPGIADIGVMAGRENVKCVLAQPRDLEHASSQDIEVVGAQSWALEAINLNWILSYS